MRGIKIKLIGHVTRNRSPLLVAPFFEHMAHAVDLHESHRKIYKLV
jgi:hypothetical protein